MRPYASVIEPERLDFEILVDDGEPLDTAWHGLQISLLLELAHRAMTERGTTRFYAGGNQFVYWSREQARAVATEPPARTRHFRGPDFFFVEGVEPRDDRQCWIAWEEGGQVPDVIVELLSPSTAALDRGLKKDEYERSLGAPELFHYDPDVQQLAGWRLVDGRYRPLRPAADGRLHSRGLGLWLGTWSGHRLGQTATWLRLFDGEGRMIPTAEEGERVERAHTDAERARAEAERARADAERARADAESARAAASEARTREVEAELARLRALVGERAVE